MSETGTSWRDQLQIHPACELFPRLPHDELLMLGEDIKKNRLQERVKLIRQDDRYVVIDGRNRLDAVELVGLPIQIFEGTAPNRRFFEMISLESLGISAEAYVIAINIRRRHLSGEDRHRVIGELLKLDPSKSDRQIGREANADHKTVGEVRDQLVGRGEIPHIALRTDTKGRRQPAHKPAVVHLPPRPTLPGPENVPPPERLEPMAAPDAIEADQHINVVRAAIQGVINVRDVMKTDFGVVAFFLSPKEREAERKRAYEAIGILQEWDEALAKATTPSAASTTPA